MTARRLLSDLSTDAQKREHDRKQEKLDYHHRIYIRCCNCLLILLVIIIFFSFAIFILYILKCPYISEQGVNLLIEAWKYIGSYIFGGLSVKYGLKNSKD